VIEQPTFDFSNISYGWSKRWASIVMKIDVDSALIDNPARPDADPELVAQLRVKRLEALNGWDDLVTQRDALLCEVLVSVPRGWLVLDAPDEIDWHNPDSLGQYLLESRIADLLNAMAEARNTREKK